MTLFRQNVLIFLKRQGLEVYSSGKSKLVFDFTPETVVAEEIKDKEKLRAQLAEFLENNGLIKSSKVIVLAEELIFQKELAGKAKLLEELPFPKEKIISKDYPAKNIAVAVNGEMFDLFDRVDYIVPITLLEMSTVDENNFKQILVNKNLLKQASLLEITDSRRTVDLKLILVLSLTLVLIGGGLFYFLRPGKKVVTVEPKTPSQEITETKPATVSAVIVNQKAKKDLTIVVFNGTGGAGDAGKTQKALETLGYQNIEVGNLDTQNATASSITYLPGANTYLVEVTAALQKLFKLEPLLIATASSFFDLQIITGK